MDSYIETLDHITIHHLGNTAVDERHGLNAIAFKEDQHGLWTCCRTLQRPLLIPIRVCACPLRVDVVGQIIPDRCFIIPTSRNTFLNIEGTRTKPIASFWVESRSDPASRVEWSHFRDAILSLCRRAAHIFTTDFSKLFHIDRASGAMRIRIEWHPELASDGRTVRNLHVSLLQC